MKIINILLLVNIFIFSAKPKKTISNLLRAYQAEANDIKTYESFARIANDEEHRQVAKLYRAVIGSKTFHMRNYSNVLKQMGIATESIKYNNVQIKSTRENLEYALIISDIEIEKMYPKYIKRAEKDCQLEAKKTLIFALNSENSCKGLFVDALQNLGFNKIEDYYVSTLTGDIFKVEPGVIPPISDVPDEQYVKVE